MKYRVIWMPAAERRLTEIWLGSRWRNSIRIAASQIDVALERNPHECGESRELGQRMMFEWPIGVLLEVDDEDQLVRVLSVWSF